MNNSFCYSSKTIITDPCGIFEKMTSFSQFSSRLGTRKINGGRKFSENMRSNVRNRLKFAKISKWVPGI